MVGLDSEAKAVCLVVAVSFFSIVAHSEPWYGWS